MATENTPGNRLQRRHAQALERRARSTGEWGEWERTPLPDGMPTAKPGGWLAKIREVAKNRLYAVLIRPIETPGGIVHHLAMRTASSLEPPWRDKQRIKNELFGAEAHAVEIMPRESELVDEADMYHMWILPASIRFPFGLK